MVFCSPSICHVEPRSMVLIMHQSLNGCVLSFWRNGAAKLTVECCCFFMTTRPVHKYNIVQTAIRQASFIELNHLAYSPDISPSNSHLFSNLKKFLRGKNFSSNAETVTTVDDYLTDLDSEFFFVKAYKAGMITGSVLLLVKVSTCNKGNNCFPTI